jgi:hypothetical protein
MTIWDGRPDDPRRLASCCICAWLRNLVIPERVTPPGRLACQRCELMLSPFSPSPSLVADAEGWSCADTRAIAQRELSELVTFMREATPAVFRFGGNHSPRGVKLRQVGPIAFDSDPGPFRSSPPASPGDRRDAKRGGGRGVTFRSECEGMRWDRADAVTGRGEVQPVNPKERKYATPLFGGAHFGARRIRDAARLTTS